MDLLLNRSFKLPFHYLMVRCDPTVEKTRDEWFSNPIAPTEDAALPYSIPSSESMSFTPRTQRARTSLVDGGKLVFYRNGTEKETRPDGTCVIRFPNGDIKCTSESEFTVAYYHAKERVRSSVQTYFLSTLMRLTYCFLYLFLLDDSHSTWG
jgi:hypothetical protein